MKHTQQGVTLIELMVTITVLGILLSITAPSMSHFLRENRVVSAANGLLFQVQYARSEAIKRRQDIRLCPSQSTTACDSNNWNDPLITLSEDNEVLKFYEASPVLSVTASDMDMLIFSTVGQVSGSKAGTIEPVPTLVISQESSNRNVCIEPSGNAYVTEGTCL